MFAGLGATPCCGWGFSWGQHRSAFGRSIWTTPSIDHLGCHIGIVSALFGWRSKCLGCSGGVTRTAFVVGAFGGGALVEILGLRVSYVCAAALQPTIGRHINRIYQRRTGVNQRDPAELKLTHHAIRLLDSGKASVDEVAGAEAVVHKRLRRAIVLWFQTQPGARSPEPGC